MELRILAHSLWSWKYLDGFYSVMYSNRINAERLNFGEVGDEKGYCRTGA